MNLVEESNDDIGGGKDTVRESIMLYNFKGDFSYGGSTISAEEMLDHLQNMLTADRVVDWVTHGLQLPQYAQAFRRNAVNGLDFPALIEDYSCTLSDELGVHSLLHRKKITHAIVRQMFGLGAVPGPPVNIQCAPARCGAIQLQWDSPSFCGYPPLHNYLIQKRVDNVSSWMLTGNTTENSFLDYNGIHYGIFFAYRIQSWGGHGPSEWVQIHGCHNGDTLSFDEHCDLQTMGKPGSSVPFVNVDVFSGNAQISSSDSDAVNGDVQTSADWGWMYSVNGFLLLLGIISRQSLFFHTTLAMWILFRKKVLGTIQAKLVRAQNSQYPLLRLIGNTFVKVLGFWQLIQASMSDLSQEVNIAQSRATFVKPCSQLARSLFTANDDYHGAIGFSTADSSFEDMIASLCYQEDVLSSHILSGKEGWASSLNKLQYADSLQTKADQGVHSPGNSLLLDSQFLKAGDSENLMKIYPDFKDDKMEGKNIKRVEATQDGKYLSINDSRLDNFVKQSYGRVENFIEHSFETMHASEGKRKDDHFTTYNSNRNRFRCNFEGCKARFDRWHSLSDWQMKFRKHYCRECQCVFCIKHTRISPHGPLGQCGLESNCVCVACFEGLSLEAQEKLEQMNKLRVRPYISNNSVHHERKWGTNPNLNVASTQPKATNFDHFNKDDWSEADDSSGSSCNNVNDSYPPNLDLPSSGDSSDGSLSYLSRIFSALSRGSHKSLSSSSDYGHGSSKYHLRF
eukprot:Gb_01581 [translate_table: standard]